MITLSKEKWNNIEEGKLTTAMSIEEFKSEFGITNEEFEKAVRSAQTNEYGTQDLSFSDNEDDSIVAELKNNMITHIYKQ